MGKPEGQHLSSDKDLLGAKEKVPSSPTSSSPAGKGHRHPPPPRPFPDLVVFNMGAWWGHNNKDALLEAMRRVFEHGRALMERYDGGMEAMEEGERAEVAASPGEQIDEAGELRGDGGGGGEAEKGEQGVLPPSTQEQQLAGNTARQRPKLQLVWKSCTANSLFWADAAPALDEIARANGWAVLDVRQVRPCVCEGVRV